MRNHGDAKGEKHSRNLGGVNVRDGIGNERGIGGGKARCKESAWRHAMRPASPGSVHSHREGEEGYGDGQPDQRRETAGVAVACVQNHTPLAPRAGGADYGPAHTHHSRNQAGVRGSVSCGISPAWCVHVLIETNRDAQ